MCALFNKRKGSLEKKISHLSKEAEDLDQKIKNLSKRASCCGDAPEKSSAYSPGPSARTEPAVKSESTPCPYKLAHNDPPRLSGGLSPLINTPVNAPSRWGCLLGLLGLFGAVSQGSTKASSKMAELLTSGSFQATPLDGQSSIGYSPMLKKQRALIRAKAIFMVVLVILLGIILYGVLFNF